MEFVDLYVKQNIAASGQSAIIVKIFGKNYIYLLSSNKLIPVFDNDWISSKIISKYLWKVCLTICLSKLDDDFNISK